jgi:hypothetical protein
MRGGYIEFVATKPNDMVWTKQESRNGEALKYPFKLEIKPTAIFRNVRTKDEPEGDTLFTPPTPRPTESRLPVIERMQPSSAVAAAAVAAGAKQAAAIPFPSAQPQAKVGGGGEDALPEALASYAATLRPVILAVNQVWQAKEPVLLERGPEVYVGLIGLFFNRALADGHIGRPVEGLIARPAAPQPSIKDRFAEFCRGREMSVEFLLKIENRLKPDQKLDQVAVDEMERIIGDSDLRAKLAKVA